MELLISSKLSTSQDFIYLILNLTRKFKSGYLFTVTQKFIERVLLNLTVFCSCLVHGGSMCGGISAYAMLVKSCLMMRTTLQILASRMVIRYVVSCAVLNDFNFL